MQNIRLKAKTTIKSSVIHYQKAMTMQNSKHMLEHKFDNLHYHAKSQVKRKTTAKNKSNTSLKRSGHLESIIGNLKGYTFI